MSGKAMAWSRGVKVGNARAKQVLRELCIAQNDETGFCSPSIKSLVELTEMTESTVLKALAHLREAGFIEVKKRKTPSGWANCYSFPALEGTLKTEGTINVKGTLKTEDTLKTEGTIKFEGEGTLKSEGRGTLKFEGVKKEEKNNKKFSFAHACDSAACTTVDDIPADVFGPDPDISNPPVDANVVPAKKPAKKKRGYRCEVDRPADVDPQLWTDFIKNRQTKKCPVTQTLLRRYAEKGKLCGMSLSQVLTTIIERNWQGFEPSWLLKEQEGRTSFKATPERPSAPSYFSVNKPAPKRADDDGAHELFKGLLA